MSIFQKQDLANQPTENGSPASSDQAAQDGKLSSLNSEIEELRRKIDEKDEEIKLYRTKYEDSSKQIANMVSLWLCVLLMCLAEVISSCWWKWGW